MSGSESLRLKIEQLYFIRIIEKKIKLIENVADWWEVICEKKTKDKTLKNTLIKGCCS